MRLTFVATALAAASLAGGAQAQAPRYVTPDPQAVYSQAVQAGDFLFMSGLLSAQRGTIQQESKAILDDMGAILKAQGLSYRDVVKCTVMIKDMAEWGAFNEVYMTYFEPGRRPARSAFGANALARDARVELECMAYNPAK